MTPLTTLADRWRRDADLLASYGDDRSALIIRRLADDLTSALGSLEDERLTLDEAALESGYSKGQLSRMIREERVPNAGRHRSPRVRRGDLPKKPPPKRSSGGFDPVAAARSALR